MTSSTVTHSTVTHRNVTGDSKLDATRTILVVGATGTLGGAVTGALVAAGAQVRALVRSDEAIDRLPAGVTPVRGDLRDPISLQFAAAGAYAAFYVSPHEPDEEAMAEAFIRACRVSDTRIVFAGVDTGGDAPLLRWVRRIAYGAVLPHYRGKLRLADQIYRSGTRPVVLGATNFFQNDEAFLDELLDGRFVLPLRSCNRVDVRDIAQAAVRALLEPGFPSGAYPVVGPESLTSADCAATWSGALGRSVTDAGTDEAAWDRAARQAYRGHKLVNVLPTYEFLRRRKVPTSAGQVRATTELLGRAPTPYDSYVRDVVASLALRSS